MGSITDRRESFHRRKRSSTGSRRKVMALLRLDFPLATVLLRPPPLAREPEATAFR
jgi:hypothetical protein